MDDETNEVELNKGDVLVSDFNDWHFVLNNWFCSDNEQEDSGDGERRLQGTTGRIEI